MGCERSTRIDGGVSGQNKVGNPCRKSTYFMDICQIIENGKRIY